MLKWFKFPLGKKEQKRINMVPFVPKSAETITGVAYGTSEEQDTALKKIDAFCTIVQVLNEGLEDSRLDTRKGTVDAVKEYLNYCALHDYPAYAIFNPSLNVQQKPTLFFEV